MRFLNGSKANNSSKDAKMFAPCFSTAKKEMDIADITDIAIAMSVLLCLVLSLLGNLIAVEGIIILSIILICRGELKKKAV